MRKTTRIISAAAAAAMLANCIPYNVFAAGRKPVQEGSFSYMPALEEEAVQDKYFYTDEYFSGTSEKSNVHLRSMSMALAPSTMGTGGSSFVTELYEGVGFEDISIGDMNDTPTRDTIGTAIAHKNIDGQEVVAVAIRGSEYDCEWGANLTTGEEGDIEGFAKPAEKVLARPDDYLKANGLDDVKLWITGYSRGGAVAELVAAHINEHPGDYCTSPDEMFVYTFEAPNSSADDTVYENIHSLRNKNDIINYVYPENWGIFSQGTTEWIGDDKTLNIKNIINFDELQFVDDGDVVSKDDKSGSEAESSAQENNSS